MKNSIVFMLSILLLLVLILNNPVYSQEIVSFTNHHGIELEARINEKRGTIDRIYGIRENISLYGLTSEMLDSISIAELGFNMVNEYSEQLNITKNDISIRSIDTDGEWWFVEYHQTVNGIPIEYSDVGFTIDPNGDIVTLGGRIHTDIPSMPSVLISADAALDKAYELFRADTVEILKEPELVILPVEYIERYSYAQAYKIKLRSLYPLKSSIVYISASDGELLKEIDTMLHSGGVSGWVSGSWWPFRETNNQEHGNFEGSQVVVDVYNSEYQWLDGGITHTDQNGLYSFVFWHPDSHTYDIKIYLDNPRVQIRNYPSNSRIMYFTGGPSGQYNQYWPAGDGTNVLIHATKIWSFFKSSPFHFNGMDYAMRGYINLGSGFLAGADGDDIFFGTIYGRHWARSSQVVYHEYTHNVIYKVYGEWIGFPELNSQGYAMDEGISDYFAATMTNYPLIAEDFSETPLDFPRNLNNDYTLQDNWEPNDPHHNGQIIGGALWRLRQTISNTAANNLAFKALQVTPRAYNFADYLYNIYVIDNGTYNAAYRSQITASFEHHGITRTPPPLPPPSAPSITLDATGINPKLNWNAVSGADSYKIYRGTMQGQPGTVGCHMIGDYYHIGTTTSTTYTDHSVWIDPNSDILACYYATSVNQIGESGPSNKVGVHGMAPLKEDELITAETISLPEEFAIFDNYPNPFNPVTTIRYNIPESSTVSLIIYDITGREVRRLADGTVEPGYHTAVWDGTGISGTTVSSGVYIYRFTAVPANESSHEGITTVRKMVFTK